jgi:hypothetical protein
MYKSGRGRKPLPPEEKKSKKIIMYLNEKDYFSIVKNKIELDELDSKVVKRLLNEAYDFNISIE